MVSCMNIFSCALRFSDFLWHSNLKTFILKWRKSLTMACPKRELKVMSYEVLNRHCHGQINA